MLHYVQPVDVGCDGQCHPRLERRCFFEHAYNMRLYRSLCRFGLDHSNLAKEIMLTGQRNYKIEVSGRRVLPGYLSAQESEKSTGGSTQPW